MANIKSAKKRILQTARRNAVNRDRVGRMRTAVKKVETAIAAGDGATAKEALISAQPEIMKGAQKGVIHKNKAARTMSRLSARVKALES